MWRPWLSRAHWLWCFWWRGGGAGGGGAPPTARATSASKILTSQVLKLFATPSRAHCPRLLEPCDQNGKDQELEVRWLPLPPKCSLHVRVFNTLGFDAIGKGNTPCLPCDAMYSTLHPRASSSPPYAESRGESTTLSPVLVMMFASPAWVTAHR